MTTSAQRAAVVKTRGQKFDFYSDSNLCLSQYLYPSIVKKVLQLKVERDRALLKAALTGELFVVRLVIAGGKGERGKKRRLRKVRSKRYIGLQG